jgi:RNA-binding protein 25
MPTDTPDTQSVVPPHLHDLQEADLPENQRGLVISEIELFRKRAVKKGGADKTAGVGPVNAVGGNTGFGVPREPRERNWGHQQRQGSFVGGVAPGAGGPPTGPATPARQGSQSNNTRIDGPPHRSSDPQSYQQAPEFVKAEAGKKTDEERDRDLRAKKTKADDQEFKHVSSSLARWCNFY